MLLTSLLFGLVSISQVPGIDYELVWQDEFEGQWLDESNWKLRYPGQRRKAYNNKKYITLQKGYLALRTELVNDTIYTAMIGTQHRFETTYGYFEVRCILPQEEGHWAAFWMQTADMGKFIGEPEKAGAEIDIFEYLPIKPKQIHHTIHYDGYEDSHQVKHKLVKKRKFKPSEWHTFGLEWTPEAYTYYIDGKKHFKVKEGVSQRDQYIVLSLEV